MTSQVTKDQASGSLKEITLNELSNKVTGDDVWLALDGFVYEVPTSWIERHPGGAQAIISCTGKDATSLIRAMHNTQTTALIKKMMKRVAVMKYDDKEMTPAQKRNLDIEQDFALLNEHVIREGWYKKPLSAYLFDVVRVASFLVLALWLLYQSQTRFEEIHSLQQKMTVVLGSVLLGAFLQNIAFFGHDAGHGSITADKTKDSRMGIMIGNGLSGVSMSWWKSTHNCHQYVQTLF
jgi:delta8-fatty-acid desaturase